MHIILERQRSIEFATKIKKRQGNSIFQGLKVKLLLPVANAKKQKMKKTKGKILDAIFSDV